MAGMSAEYAGFAYPHRNIQRWAPKKVATRAEKPLSASGNF
jgi:hypothetical protein